MPWRILTLLLLALAWAPAWAGTATARIERVAFAGVELRDVAVRLHWPASASHGELRLDAGSIDAPDLGYRFTGVRWQCPLSPPDEGAWRCEGPLTANGGAAMRLAVDLSAAGTDAVLSQGAARLSLQRTAAAPDATRLQLAQVPVAWAQALLARGWPSGRLGAGTADGTLVVDTATAAPLRVEGALDLAGLSLESQDGSIAAANVDARVRFDYRRPSGGALVSLEGDLGRGEALFGNAYVVVGAEPVAVAIDARQLPEGGWSVPRFDWRDGATLSADARAELGPDGNLRALALQARSAALDEMPARYLSGWLGLAGLAGLQLEGGLDARASVENGALHAFDVDVHAVDFRDARQRFRIEGLQGDLRHTAGASVASELRWQGGALYDIPFGPVSLPLRSGGGTLQLREAVLLPVLGGQLRLGSFDLRPPGMGQGLRIGFALELDSLQVEQLTQALGWPSFRGTLSGRIPSARYEGERLDFEGGLSFQVFDGHVDVDALSMERPFGVAPTLSADVSLRDLDLLGITEVFDFGSITGRLHGRIDGLRLVDWSATAFDAELHTEPKRGVRQRISQRAVQDISSVGDASFVNSLQGQLIGLFDDFGYRRIGIACRLENEVCRMSGLHSAGAGFTIVEGAGVPKLQVVGFNRDVDWPTLVERLASAATGDVAPVVE